jgi:uncharacterized protein YdeI (YjbR/CyaY-like superfamily)
VNEAEVIAFGDAAGFEAWLDACVNQRAGVWLKIAKKGSGVPSLTDDEAVDLGLCYGWISGRRKSYDHVYYLQKYVPRRPRSRWSQVNVAKVGELIAAGRMRPPGLAGVEAAKADGRWAAACESQRDATVPPDLTAALAASPAGCACIRRTQQDPAVRRDPETHYRSHLHCPHSSAPQGDGRARSARRPVNRTGSWARPGAVMRWNARLAGARRAGSTGASRAGGGHGRNRSTSNKS